MKLFLSVDGVLPLSFWLSFPIVGNIESTAFKDYPDVTANLAINFSANGDNC